MSTQREKELVAITRKALNGEPLTEAEFALLTLIENEDEWAGPPVRLPRIPEDNPVVGKCSKCGLQLRGIMGYVCTQFGCPTFGGTIC